MPTTGVLIEIAFRSSSKAGRSAIYIIVTEVWELTESLG